MTGITEDPATFFDRVCTDCGLVRVPTLLPQLSPTDSTCPYEKSLQWRLSRRYVEAVLVSTSDPNASLVNVPGGGKEALQVLPGAEAGLRQAELFIRRIVAGGAVDMKGLVVDVNFAAQTTTSNYAAAILLAAVSVMTKCPIKTGTAALGELGQNGIIMPIPRPVNIWTAAARLLVELGEAPCQCNRLLLASVSADEIIPSIQGAAAPEHQEMRKRIKRTRSEQEEPKREGVTIVKVTTVADLLNEGLQWEGKRSMKEAVMKAVMTELPEENMPVPPAFVSLAER